MGDYFVGLYLLDLLDHGEWISRRVDTVELLDDVTVRQHVTTDVNVDHILAKADQYELANADVLRHATVLPAPIAMLRKDLLMDFDMIDPSAMRTPVPKRDEDAYASACVLFAVATDILDGSPDHRDEPLTLEVSGRFFDVAYGFPEEARLSLSSTPANWPANARAQWQTLMSDTEFTKLLRLFADEFVLFGRVQDSESGTSLYKFSYLAPVEIKIGVLEAMCIDPVTFDLGVRGAQSTRSYHLLFSAPADLEIVGVTPAGERTKWTGYWKRAHHRAHLYITRWDPAVPKVAISVRPVASGFLRVAMLATLLTLAVQLAAFFLREDIAKIVASGQADAAVAFLLVIPTVVSAYVSRPGPHRLSNRALSRMRFTVGASSLLPYLTAALFVLGVSSRGRYVGTGLSLVFAGLVAVYASWVWWFARKDEHDGPSGLEVLGRAEAPS